MKKPNKKDKRNPNKKDKKMNGGNKSNNGKGKKETTSEPVTSLSVTPTKQLIVSSSSLSGLSTPVSTTLSPAAGLSSSSTGTLNSGTIAAIVISSLAFILLTVVLIKLFMKKQKQGQTKSSTYEMYSEVDHSMALGDSIRVNPHGNMPQNTLTGVVGNINPEHIDQDNVYHELDPARMEPIQITQPTYDHIITSVNSQTSPNPNASSKFENGTNSVEIHIGGGSQNERGGNPLTDTEKLKMAYGQEQKTNTSGDSETPTKPEPQQSDEYFMLEPNPDLETSDTPDNSDYFVIEPDNTEMIKDKTDEI